jgi:hypothetical protein
MAIYAISDLHLSFADPKPMDIFGPVWEDHAEQIRRNWDAIVGPSDVVLIPGDISWALRFSGARPDLEFIAKRPGRKVLIRGNHDFWWQRRATARIQRSLGKGMTFLQGTSVVIDEIGITGTRGWRVDSGLQGAFASQEPAPEVEQSEKILRRELAYLENGLRSIPSSVKTRIAMLHYPPFDDRLRPNEFAHMLEKYSVDHLVYGHVHLGIGNWLTGDVDGVRYQLVSADVVGFKPKLILP